jgi:hypothetical protein
MGIVMEMAVVVQDIVANSKPKHNMYFEYKVKE